MFCVNGKFTRLAVEIHRGGLCYGKVFDDIDVKSGCQAVVTCSGYDFDIVDILFSDRKSFGGNETVTLDFKRYIGETCAAVCAAHAETIFALGSLAVDSHNADNRSGGKILLNRGVVHIDRTEHAVG